MRFPIQLVLAPVIAIALGGCAGMATKHIVANPEVKVVEVDGEKVWIAPMPEKNLWGATRWPLTSLVWQNPATEVALLTKAIEQGTGCTATYQRYDFHKLNLYAVVSCRQHG